MAKVLTFSTRFPSYHYRKGEPTYFVEKILKSLNNDGSNLNDIIDWNKFKSCLPKHHTIRKGRRWKVGDKFSPRIWSGKPYYSKQIVLADDCEVKKVWEVKIFIEFGSIYIGIRQSENSCVLLPFGEVAQNDGLTFEEMKHWFNVKPDKPFVGQIICWNDCVEY